MIVRLLIGIFRKEFETTQELSGVEQYVIGNCDTWQAGWRSIAGAKALLLAYQ